MGGNAFFVLFALALVFAIPVVADAQDSAETLIEQQRALEAEAMGPQNRVGVMSPEADNLLGSAGLLFVGVDDATVSTYAIDPIDNTTTAQFIGFEVWGAALIPAGIPGDGVVYFNDGSSLYRWPANGVPELCCTLTYQTATSSVVSVTYDPSGARLLFTKNISVEAVYALPVVAANCPAACDMTQEIVYDTGLDVGGLALDTSTGDLYGTDDGANDSVVMINNDGTHTVIAAYPAGETDIDGLAYGNGKLYLVIDQPGDIYVYDIASGLYETPLTNPWTSSEIFCGGAFGGGLIPVELQSLTIE
jgi:hypothetical protein